MTTATDASILFDILGGDPQFFALSLAALAQCLDDGPVVVCDVVWAEVTAAYARFADGSHPLETMGLRYDPILAPAAELAGAVWGSYRKRGGPRTRLIPDFLVGAHALTQADRLLTRDRGFRREYFPGLLVIDPTESG